MRITLLELDPQTHRRRALYDQHLDPAQMLRPAPLLLSESSELTLRLYPSVPSRCEARVKIGNVLIASTLRQERPDFLITPADAAGEDEADYVVCRGRLLRDWVGTTDLTVEVSEGETWRTVLTLDLNVTAGKMQQEAYEALFAELAEHSAAALLDVWGKT